MIRVAERVRALFRTPPTVWHVFDVPDRAVAARPWCIIPDSRVVTYAGIPLPTPLPRPLGPLTTLGVEAKYTDSADLEFAHLVFYDAAGDPVATMPLAHTAGDMPGYVSRGHRWVVRVAL